MRTTISLIAAPTALSPGGYVKAAYANRSEPKTPQARLEILREGPDWRVAVQWACAEPVYTLGDEVDRFVDAVAVIAPMTPDAPWMTMGEPGKAVGGVLWRADGEDLIGIRAEGLGTVERRAAPAGCRAKGTWEASAWQVEFDLKGFAILDSDPRLAVAVWQGARGDRGGLKSVSPGWIEIAP